MTALTSAPFNCAQIKHTPRMEDPASAKKTLFEKNEANTDADDKVTAQATKTTPTAASETKLSSQVCRDRITSSFALVLIQSKRISNKHSGASSHVSLSPSTGLQDNSAADNSNKSKKRVKEAKSKNSQEAAPDVSGTKKKKSGVSP